MNEINFKLTDELWQEMVDLEGLPIAAITVWDSSLVDESMPEAVTDKNRVFVDIDIFLANQTKLEIYGVMVAMDGAEMPIIGLDAIGDTVSQHTQEGAAIHEIASDEEDTMVLVISNEAGALLTLAVAAWLEDVWEELPEEEA